MKETISGMKPNEDEEKMQCNIENIVKNLLSFSFFFLRYMTSQAIQHVTTATAQPSPGDIQENKFMKLKTFQIRVPPSLNDWMESSV